MPAAIRGEITVGDFAVFNMYLFRLVWPLIALGYVVNLYQRGTASLKRMNAILAVAPTIADSRDVQAQPPIRGEIEFRNLTFRYHPNDEPVLHKINLRIPAGETVAFVGRTGSGKSTLVNLIARVIEAPEDTVFVDGISVRDYPLAQLRSSIGYVPQGDFSFQRQHLPKTSPSAWKNRRQRRLSGLRKCAGLTEDVAGFPAGFETLVGERGLTLSGGQKQRTAIARANLREPKILILDDALSSVDTYTEEKILGKLRGVMRGRTSLIVSHRISTVRDADLICVLDEGRIIEQASACRVARAGWRVCRAT